MVQTCFGVVRPGICTRRQLSCDTAAMSWIFINPPSAMVAGQMMLDMLTPDNMENLAANILRSRVQHFSEFRSLARQVGIGKVPKILHNTTLAGNGGDVQC